MAKSQTNPTTAPEASDVPHPGQPPRWESPLDDPRRAFKAQQRAYRKQVADRRADNLAEGETQFRVAICGKDGTELIVMDRGEPARSLVVGARSEAEARDKFCRYNGIHAGLENVKVVGRVGA